MDRIDLDLYSKINKFVRNIIWMKGKNLVGDIVDLDWKKLDELVAVDTHHSVEDLDLNELIDSVDLYVVVLVVVVNSIVVEQSVVVLIHPVVVSESVVDVTVVDIVLERNGMCPYKGIDKYN